MSRLQLFTCTLAKSTGEERTLFVSAHTIMEAIDFCVNYNKTSERHNFDRKVIIESIKRTTLKAEKLKYYVIERMYQKQDEYLEKWR